MDSHVESIENLTPYRKLDFEKENNSDSSKDVAKDDEYIDLEIGKGVLKNHLTIPEAKIPKIGMEFDNDDSAFEFYNEYARLMGFSARKSSSHKDLGTGNILDRKYCCSCEGERGYDKRDSYVKSHRPETRTYCCAQMKVSCRHSGKYRIVKFVPEHHGHDLVSPAKALFLRSHRTISVGQAAQIENLENSGIPPKAGLDYMARQVGGRENVGFIVEDVRNYLHSKRTMQMKDGDAGGVLNYLQLKQSEDPSFFYALQIDKDDLITNIFWADGQMMVDYAYFRYVVCFDTTYRKNKDGRPFALFVGVNHHKQCTVFGAALLYDETAETFMWLFDTFVKAMNGKKPVTILTDQDAAMAKALEEKWPETHHRLCIWHIYQNAAGNIGNVFEKFSTFATDFSSCIYDFEEEEDFIDAWKNMLDKYALQNNNWLKKLFKKKEKWALVYGRKAFCGDMISTQRSESLNSVLKRYASYKHNLLQFFHHFGRLVDDRRYEEMKADFRTCHSTQHLSLEVEVLKHARKIYTHEVFKLFQVELSIGYDSKMEIISESDDMSKYIITPLKRPRPHTVTYDASNGEVFCSCKKFEFAGILCCHALKVLTSKNIVQIPELYVMRRWTKKSKKGIVGASLQPSPIFDDPTSNMDKDNEKKRIGERYRELCRLHNQLTTRAALTEEAFEIARSGLIKMIGEVDAISENNTNAKPAVKTSRPKYAVKKSFVTKVTENHSPMSQIFGEDESFDKAESSTDKIMVQGIKMKEKPKVRSGKRMKSGLEQATGKRKQKQHKSSLNNQSPILIDTFANYGQKPSSFNSSSSSTSQSMSYPLPPPLSQTQNYEVGGANQTTHLDSGAPYRASGHALSNFAPSVSQLSQNCQVGVPANQTTHLDMSTSYRASGHAFSYVQPSLSQFSQNYEVGVPNQTTHLNLGIPCRATGRAISYLPPSLSQLPQKYQVGVPSQTSRIDLSIPYHARGHALSFASPSQMKELSTGNVRQQPYNLHHYTANDQDNSTNLAQAQPPQQQEFGGFMFKDSTLETKEQNASSKDGGSHGV